MARLNLKVTVTEITDAELEELRAAKPQDTFIILVGTDVFDSSENIEYTKQAIIKYLFLQVELLKIKIGIPLN